jgi:hypothetical protein
VSTDKLVLVHEVFTDGAVCSVTLPPRLHALRRIWTRKGVRLATLEGFHASGEPNGRRFTVDLTTGRATRPFVEYPHPAYHQVFFWPIPERAEFLNLEGLREVAA